MIKKIWNRIFPPKNKAEFSIGIYTGKNPFEMKSYKGNPVLTKEDVTDRKAAYVADPFMIKIHGVWYMFFEVRSEGSYLTELAYAISKNGFNWQYRKVIQPDKYFQSFPFVFQSEGWPYMIAEGHKTKSIRIYEAKEFPQKWVPYATVAEGRDYVDPTIFKKGDKWFVIASTTENSDLFIFYANDLKGPWTEHPLNPIVKLVKKSARPAGRIIEYNKSLFRFTQDCSNYYGEKVLAFKINKISTTEYKEEFVGTILDKGKIGWNSKGMHTFDAHAIEKGWIAAVDGYKEK